MTQSSAAPMPRRSNPIVSFFKAIDGALCAMQESVRRGREIETYLRMTDAQLHARGLRRDTIVDHVFKDAR